MERIRGTSYRADDVALDQGEHIRGGDDLAHAYHGGDYKVSERRLSIEEVAEAADAGKLKEAFGSGTAAVISPIGELKWDEKVMTINNGEIGTISQHLYDTLTGIQWGKLPDPYGWTVEVK